MIYHENMMRREAREFARLYYKDKLKAEPPAEPPEWGDLKPVEAYANHGRWVVDCPHGCGDAKLVSREAEPVFLCTEQCPGNQEWYRVVMPVDLSKIEAELMKRPAVAPDRAFTRNWYPGESLTALQAENIAHGLD